MRLDGRGHSYPRHAIHAQPFEADLGELFPAPTGLEEDPWPSAQLQYLGKYLDRLGCKSVLVEDHYVDRDYISDLSIFYARSLRSYPNFCHRLHFFSKPLSDEQWRAVLKDATARGAEEASKQLQDGYLGFAVVRPLPSSPVGRTVLATYPAVAPDGRARDFGGTREYSVSLAGLRLRIRGLAFQQQDRGVSACATTALWCALHRVASAEGLEVPTPAEITEAASRYILAGGRALPSEGLNVHQICEATRSAGLAPVVIQATSLEVDRAQIDAYTASGFPPVLALLLPKTEEGHAVCAVGVRRGPLQPSANPEILHLDRSSGVERVFIHDDRVGPYAACSLESETYKGAVRTAISIKWPGEDVEVERAILHSLIVPVPPKVRLSLGRMRIFGAVIANAIGEGLLPDLNRKVVLGCRYELGRKYQERAFGFGLGDAGLVRLNCDTVLSRYVGLVELSGPAGPLLDILLDATETQAGNSVLAVVRRADLPKPQLRQLEYIATKLAAPFIS